MYGKLKLIGVVFAFLSVQAHAVPITWSVSGTFSDGGGLSGSFIFDADSPVLLDGLSDISITTSGGNTALFAGLTYDDTSTIQTFQNESIGLGFLLVIGSGNGLLTLNIKDPGAPVLSNAGGSFNAVPFDWDERVDGNVNVRRLDNNIGGQLASVSAAVPEPGTMGLISLSLIGLGLARRRQTA